VPRSHPATSDPSEAATHCDRTGAVRHRGSVQIFRGRFGGVIPPRAIGPRGTSNPRERPLNSLSRNPHPPGASGYAAAMPKAAFAGSTKPLRRDAERNRLRILASADAVFAERGLDATLDDVADHADLGIGTVYRRFTDKEALIDALFERHLDCLVEIAAEALRRDDPWDGVVYLLEASLAQQAAHRGLRDVVLHGHNGCIRIRSSRERIVPAAAKVFERARIAGVLRPDLEPTDISMLCLMIGSVAENTMDVAPGLWRRYLAIVLDGLVGRREQTRPLPVRALTDDELTDAMRTSPRRRR
jgi:AcrR family transcriptional regulator